MLVALSQQRRVLLRHQVLQQVFFLPLIWKSKHSTPSWKNNYRLYGSKWWNKLSARWKERWPGSPKKVEDVIVIRPCRSSQCFNEVETWTIWWKRNSPSGRNSSLIAFSHSTGSLVFKPPDPSSFNFGDLMRLVWFAGRCPSVSCYVGLFDRA